MNDYQSGSGGKGIRVAAAAANIARGAAYGGVYGAAAEAAKSFLPELIKLGVVLLFVVVLFPLFAFVSLPNILFGFNSSTDQEIIEFTDSAQELTQIYDQATSRTPSILERLVNTILPGFRLPDGSAQYHSLIPDGGAHYGLTVTGIGNNSTKLVEALQDGKLVIALMSKGHFTNGGHFIVLRGITEDGKILVADPASVKRSNQEWELGIVVNEARRGAAAGGPFWVFS